MFIILLSLTVTWFSEKMLISTRCIHGFMSNLIEKSWTVSTQEHTHRTFSDIISHLLSLHSSHSQLEIHIETFLAACGQPHESLIFVCCCYLYSFSLKLTFLQPLNMARELWMNVLRIGQELSGSNLTVIMQLSSRTAKGGADTIMSPQLFGRHVNPQNLHWKLGQQAPSFGSILGYLETTA